MSELDALAEQIKVAIPLARHLGFRLLEREGERLTLSAPLALNQNDKGTMFAGSISTLSTLAGWALTGQLAQDAGFQADVLAVNGHIDYLLPIQKDAVFAAQADAALLVLFADRLKRHGKARLHVTVEAKVGELVGARFSGDYLARLL